MKTTDFLIIGAGITGLLCATELRRAGHSVRLLEKGRGYGGRMATRRMCGGRLDHGAQFFTVRDSSFKAYVDEWLSAGVIREWFRHHSSDDSGPGHPRYCGLNGMTDVPKYLAKDLDVCLLEQVIELIRDTRQWGVRTQSGNLYTAKHLVITAPLPQALALLDTSGLNYAGANLAALRAVRYDKGLATLAILDGPSSLPEHGGVSIADGPIRWIADNQKKGISENVSAVTIHASAEFAAEHWDSSNDVRGQLMLDAAAPHLGAKVVDYDCHRWGYGFPINPMPELCYFSWGLSLVLAGDAFGGPRVEGSALSGLAAARELMECSSLA